MPIMKPLAPFHDRMNVLSGLDGGKAVVGGHERACSMWLTGCEPKRSAYDVNLGPSADQLAAKELGKDTQLESLELATENAAEILGGVQGYNAAYTNTIAWRTATTPLPMENRPRAVFERLFGDGESTDEAARMARIKEDKSILDFVSQDINRLAGTLGPGDRSKLGEYLDGIRDVERRIQKAEEQSSRDLPVVSRPVSVPDTYSEHVKLLFDLQVLAFQTDLTRVSTFMMGREMSFMVYPHLGIPEPHHALTHNRGDQAKIAQLVKINTFHVELLAYFLEKMRSTRDGEGTLLDHSMILYGSGLGDGDLHNQFNLPLALFGRGAGRIKTGGRHLHFPIGTPIANLHRAMLDLAGFPIENLGNVAGLPSTGVLDLNPVL
jgi:hypothetical protein